jgi:MYXO-CTERM domain-containing protein
LQDATSAAGTPRKIGHDFDSLRDGDYPADMRHVWLMAFGAALLTACDPPEMISERGDFRLVVEGVTAPTDILSPGYWEPPYLVLAGTRLCPQLRCDACPDDDDACHDAALHASGPVVADEEGCFVVDAPGEVVWTVDAACGVPGQEPDRARMRVLGPEEVEARVVHWLDALVTRHAARENPLVTTLGAPWRGLLPQELKVVAGEQVELAVGLFEGDTGRAVARQSDLPFEVSWTTTRGRPAIAYPSDHVDLTTFAGSESTGSLRLAGHTWPLGQVLGVPAASVTTLELSGALLHREDPAAPLLGRLTWPLGARAVGRDDAGDVVFGLPIAWSVEAGNIAYWPEETRLDRIVLADDCIPPEERAGPRELVLRGSNGDLSATLEFAWTGTHETSILNIADPDSDWAPPATCLAPAGCSCRSADPSGAALLLGLLGFIRRRRTGHAPKNMPEGACRRGHARTGMLVGACLLAPLAAGCTEDPPAMGAAEALPLGELPLELDVVQGGHSVRVGERALWVFRADTDLRSGMPATSPRRPPRRYRHPRLRLRLPFPRPRRPSRRRR